MNRHSMKAGLWGGLAAAVLAVLIVVGSRNLDHFDAALVGYTFATLFATFGITYRYAMWLQRPPTRMYWRRGWQVFLQPRFLFRNLLQFGKQTITTRVFMMVPRAAAATRPYVDVTAAMDTQTQPRLVQLKLPDAPAARAEGAAPPHAPEDPLAQDAFADVEV